MDLQLKYLKYRCESFNSSVRLQNIYGNKQAPSRDIANHFAIVEHLRYICGGGLFNSNERCSKGVKDLYDTHEVQGFFNSIPSKLLNADREIYKPGTARMATSYNGKLNLLKVHATIIDGTILELQQLETPYSVITHLGSMDDNVQEYRAVVSNCSELVHSGDYVELHPPFCEFK
eukprot:Em0001g2916a